MTKRELAAYVCEHVFEGSRPVLLVAHEGSDWQFLCGESHEPEEIPRVVGMNHIMDTDPSIRDVLDLPANWEADRDSITASWKRRKLS